MDPAPRRAAPAPHRAAPVLTAEEVKEIEDGGEVDIEAILASEMTERAESENISYLASVNSSSLLGCGPSPKLTPRRHGRLLQLPHPGRLLRLSDDDRGGSRCSPARSHPV